MSVYIHPQRKRWVYDFEHHKKRFSGYCIDPDTGSDATSKTTARRIEIKLKARIMAKAQEQPAVNPRTFTFGQAASAYASQNEGRKIWRSRKTHLKELLTFFDPGTPVQAISEARIHDYIAWARKQKKLIWKGGPVKSGQDDQPSAGASAGDWIKTESRRADATINRYLDCLRLVLTVASRFTDPLTGTPLLPNLPKVPKLREVEHMPNPVPPSVIQRLLLEAPDYLADAIKLAALTGMRKREIFSRSISDYRPELRALRISGADTKGKRDEMIPLSSPAIEIIERRVRAAKAEKIQALFFWKGRNGKGKARPLKDPKRSWEAARQKAGGGEFRFHDLKASFVTAVMISNPGAAQALARHKDASTTKRYIKVADSFLHDAVEVVGMNVLGKAEQRGIKPHTKAPYERKTKRPKT